MDHLGLQLCMGSLMFVSVLLIFWARSLEKQLNAARSENPGIQGAVADLRRKVNAHGGWLKDIGRYVYLPDGDGTNAAKNIDVLDFVARKLDLRWEYGSKGRVVTYSAESPPSRPPTADDVDELLTNLIDAEHIDGSRVSVVVDFLDRFKGTD